jgi:hypothetical protein
VLAVLLLLVALLPALPLRPPRRRRRRRVSVFESWTPRAALTSPAEKEESDEDMGFGLFD